MARFVSVVTGSADVAAELVVPHHRDVAHVLVDGLPTPGDIVDTEAMVVVRKFSAVEEWDTGLLGPEAVALLRPGGTQPDHREWHEPERLSEQASRHPRVRPTAPAPCARYTGRYGMS